MKKSFLILCFLLLLTAGLIYLWREEQTKVPAAPAKKTAVPVASPPSVEKKEAVPLTEKVKEAMVEAVLDGNFVPGAERIAWDYAWSSNDLCLATTLGGNRPPTDITKDLAQFGLGPFPLDMDIYPSADPALKEDRFTRWLEGSDLFPKIVAIRYAGEIPKFLGKAKKSLDEMQAADPQNAALDLLAAIIEIKRQANRETIAAYLNAAEKKPKFDLYAVEWANRFNEGASRSAMHLLMAHYLDNWALQFSLNVTPVLWWLQQNHEALSFPSLGLKMQEYGAQLRQTGRAQKMALSLWQEGKILAKPDFSGVPALRYEAQLWSYFEYKKPPYSAAEKKQFLAPYAAEQALFSKADAELVEGKFDECLRADFEAYFVDWNRRRRLDK